VSKLSRKRRLVLPDLQLYLTLSFLAMSAAALLFQFVAFTLAASSAASQLPNDGDVFLTSSTVFLVRAFVVSACVVLPATAIAGIAITNRVAGPVHRFEQHLLGVLEEGRDEPCRIRHGDQLQDLCALINRATAERRSGDELEPQRREAA